LKSTPFDSKANLVQKLSRFNDPRIVNVLLDLSLETGVSGMYSDLEKRININLNRGMYYEAQKEIKAKEDVLQKEIRTTLKKIAPNTKESLIAALQSQSNEKRKIASEILDSIGWKASSPDMEMKQWVINSQWEKFDAAGSAAFDFLVTTLNDSYPDNPGHAAQALAKLHDQRAVAPLMTALKGKLSGWASMRIMESLAELDAVESIAPIMDKLRQQIEIRDYNQVRYSKEVIEKCLLHFEGRAVAPLAQLLNGNIELNLFIIEILGKIGDPSAIPALLPQLDSANMDILKSTANSLRSLHWEPTQDDAGAKYYTYNQEWTRCSEMGEKAVPALLGVFHNKHENLYEGAANALKELYRSGKLSPESTANILLLNGKEIKTHNDGESLSTCTHTDEAGIYLEL
ncbi:MAG TPA: hypothetical protein VN376_05665, partial [Longilinea sp.]|nr:hypothetical protein [Longilinea sp.]